MDDVQNCSIFAEKNKNDRKFTEWCKYPMKPNVIIRDIIQNHMSMKCFITELLDPLNVGILLCASLCTIMLKHSMPRWWFIQSDSWFCF